MCLRFVHPPSCVGLWLLCRLVPCRHSGHNTHVLQSCMCINTITVHAVAWIWLLCRLVPCRHSGHNTHVLQSCMCINTITVHAVAWISYQWLHLSLGSILSSLITGCMLNITAWMSGGAFMLGEAGTVWGGGSFKSLQNENNYSIIIFTSFTSPNNALQFCMCNASAPKW